MGPLGWQETVFIFVLALLIFGPKKLPELGRTIGKALTEFKRASSELKTTFDREMRAIETETNSVKKELQSTYNEGTSYDYGSYDYDNYYNNDYGSSTPASGDASANGSAGDAATQPPVSADAIPGAEVESAMGDAIEEGRTSGETALSSDGAGGASPTGTAVG